MEFTIGPVQSTETNADPLKVLLAGKPGRTRDRRKKRQDRRRNVREGIFVSLSVKTDRRGPADRRQKGA